MAGNCLALALVQAKQAVCPPGGMGAMDKSVHVAEPFPAGVVAGIAAVPLTLPVVTKKVVEERGPRHGPHPVLPHTKPLGQAVGALRGIHGVGVQGVLTAMVGAGAQLYKKRMSHDVVCYALKMFSQNRPSITPPWGGNIR